MTVFQIKAQQLEHLEELPFKLERELQLLFEENLEKITALEFISSEFVIQNQRIDTLAFDLENQAFVIIEYKRSTNYSVLDQGVSYLNTLLRYKPDFVLEYQEKTGKILPKKSIDWSQSKVVFVSPQFTSFQKQAIDFKDLPIELWEVKRFETNIVVINGIKKSVNAPSIKTSVKGNSSDLSLVTKEVKTYSEDDLLANRSEVIQELYDSYKQAILQLIVDCEIVPKKFYIAFKKDNHNIIDIEVQHKQLKLFINAKMGQIDDAKGVTRNVSQIGHYGNGDYEIKVTDTRNLEYIMSLIKQVL